MSEAPWKLTASVRKSPVVAIRFMLISKIVEGYTDIEKFIHLFTCLFIHSSVFIDSCSVKELCQWWECYHTWNRHSSCPHKAHLGRWIQMHAGLDSVINAKKQRAKSCDKMALWWISLASMYCSPQNSYLVLVTS